MGDYVKVTSDGSGDIAEEWGKGLLLYQKATGASLKLSCDDEYRLAIAREKWEKFLIDLEKK